jgi:hypothetical protein
MPNQSRASWNGSDSEGSSARRGETHEPIRIGTRRHALREGRGCLSGRVMYDILPRGTLTLLVVILRGLPVRRRAVSAAARS